jgi:hypothetical protein
MNQLQKDHEPAPSFIRFPQSLLSVGHFVQHLAIGGDSVSRRNLKHILSSCSNLRSLAVWPIPAAKDFLPTLGQTPCLTRLSAYFLGVPYSLDQPFPNLTHLEILDFNSDSWEGHWEFLIHLPKLTHLGVGCSIKCDAVSKLLLNCPHLSLFLLMDDPNDGYRDLYGVDDNRLVLLCWESFDDVIHDWEKGANGGVDMWIFSEFIVIARGRKYISRPLPNWIPRRFDWEAYLNEDGKKWFAELRLNDSWPEARRRG